MIRKIIKLKKAQIEGEQFAFIIVLVIVGLIIVFGFKMYYDFKNAGCKTELQVFSGDLKHDTKVVGLKRGDQQIKTYNVPCGVDTVYLIDSKKEISSSFAQYPLIQDNIESGMGDDVFMMRKGAIVSSFDIGEIDISWPYFECYAVHEGRLQAKIEGKGQFAIFRHTDESENSLYDCTFIDEVNVELTKKDFCEIVREIMAAKRDVPLRLISDSELGPECDKIFDEQDRVKIERTFEYDETTGETTVRVKIDPEGTLTRLKYWEKIPKCALSALNEQLSDEIGSDRFFFSNDAAIIPTARNSIYPAPDNRIVEGTFAGENDLIIKQDDPLLVWNFYGNAGQLLDAGEDIGYKIKKEILHNCKKEFQGIIEGAVDTATCSGVCYNPSNPIPPTNDPDCGLCGGVSCYYYSECASNDCDTFAGLPGTCN